MTFGAKPDNLTQLAGWQNRQEAGPEHSVIHGFRTAGPHPVPGQVAVPARPGTEALGDGTCRLAKRAHRRPTPLSAPPEIRRRRGRGREPGRLSL